MNISTTVNKLDGLKRAIKINVSKNEYVLQYKKDLDKYKSTVKMDGFRAGKVPENIILKNYKDRIQGDTLNTIIQSSLKQALKEHNLDTASPPKITIEKSGSSESDTEYTAEFEVFPSIMLKNLADLTVEQPDVNIAEDDIDAVIKNIQKQHTKWEEKKEEAQAGDKVVLEYEGTISGEQFDNNKQDNFTFIIDDDVRGDEATVGLFKEFYKNTLGTKINMEKKFTYKMPESFADKKISGKTIEYNIKIKHIYKGIAPELNEEFYKNFGITDSDHKAFKESVSKYMKVELDQKLKSVMSAAINQKLLDENDFEIPEYMLENEVKSITSQYESMQQKIDESIKTELSLIAKKRVKLNLIYMKITEDNELSVSEKDVSEFIAKSDPASQQQILEKIQSDKDYLNHIKNKALEDVIINHILSMCKIDKVEKKFSEVVN
jgi:trigger factor